ncbi:putative prophage protein [Lactiplantibacillus plantarum]|nr:putative prophage protein [Lactiplantibacillus plantarum]
MKFYRKQPIEAEQFDGSNEMIDKYELIDAGTMLGTHHSPELYLTGSGKVDVGDWIETGVNGERWLIKNDMFKQQYAELPVIPKNVAERIITGHSLNDLIPTCGGIYRAMIQAVVYGYQKGDIGDWIINHSDMFARAWLDGYTVKADK